jgi:anti-sigma regulatory factor (Ser/Thr protein kinase)
MYAPNGRRVHPPGEPFARAGGALLSTQARTELRLPVDAIAPALARAGMRSLAKELPDSVIDDLSLLTTEVVSNAVRHGSSGMAQDIEVTVQVDHRIRVEVRDQGTGFDAVLPPPGALGQTGGWGLFLLDTLASGWGVHEEAGRTVVWFEIDTT